jgi:hypothetical protein
MPRDASVEEFMPPTRGKPPLPKAPKADDAPVEGQEVRTNLAGGFDQGARQMEAVSLEDALEAPLPTQQMDKPPTGQTQAVSPKTVETKRTTGTPEPSGVKKTVETKKPTGEVKKPDDTDDDDKKSGGPGTTKKPGGKR